MNEKIYCKDCRFCQSGYCHRMPPSLVSLQGDALFPKVDNFDWCGMAERREDVRPDFVAVGKVESGDAVYAITRGELEKMKEEKHQLRVSVQFLVNEMKSFCSYFGKHGICRKAELNCFETCEFYKSIKKYDCLEDDK